MSPLKAMQQSRAWLTGMPNMPELPEVETVRLGLQPFLEGARIDRVTLNRKDLRFPFMTLQVLLGIHWAFDSSQGIVQGRQVADHVVANLFTPTSR